MHVSRGDPIPTTGSHVIQDLDSTSRMHIYIYIYIYICVPHFPFFWDGVLILFTSPVDPDPIGMFQENSATLTNPKLNTGIKQYKKYKI